MNLFFKISATFFILFTNHSLNAQENAYIEYYDNGKPKAIGFKDKDNISYGEWTYFRENGSIDGKINFNAQGTPQGPFLFYFENGQLQTKGNYSGKGFYETEGHYEDYYKNGQLSSVGNYKNNEAVGEWLSYFDNGQIKSRTEYTSKGVIQKNTTYFKNGQVRLNATYNENGHSVGTMLLYYNNGQIQAEENYDNDGNLTGAYTSYFPNGGFLEIGNYAGMNTNQKKGVWKSYYVSGELRQKVFYDSIGGIINIKEYDLEEKLIPIKEK